MHPISFQSCSLDDSAALDLVPVALASTSVGRGTDVICVANGVNIQENASTEHKLDFPTRDDATQMKHLIVAVVMTSQCDRMVPCLVSNEIAKTRIDS